MGGLHVFVFILLGVISCCSAWISESKMKIHPGHNITLYCDCKLSTGVYIVWYRNCSRSSLILKLSSCPQKSINYTSDLLKPSSHFQFVRNQSSDTYDLLILNVTDSDEGLYYCGTEEQRVEDNKFIALACIHRYGNTTTRIILDSSKPNEADETRQCWILLASLCPAFAGLSSLFSSLLVYYLCRKMHYSNEPEVDQQSPKIRNLTRLNQDEDVCYAALEIRQASQRPKKKTQSSDFSTYSAINTSRV